MSNPEIDNYVPVIHSSEKQTLNREAWLQAAVTKLTPFFLGKNLHIPPVQVSCGFPSRNATGTKARRVGECWDGAVSADGVPQLYISPLLANVEGPDGVLATLVHELLHAIDFQAAHGPRFKKMMTKIGLEGKPTCTVAGEDLVGLLERINKELGAYPHSPLTLKKERKKQTTRQRKVVCPCCDYTCRIAQKWIDVGLPICPVPSHGPMKTELPTENETENENE